MPRAVPAVRRALKAPKGRSRAVATALGVITAVLTVGIGQTAGAAPRFVAAGLPGPTTSAPPATTATTTATTAPVATTVPAPPATTATTVPTSTTTTLPHMPVFLGVTAPPPAPLVSDAANPAKVAQAALLASQISAQSTIIDQLAITFARAQATADAAGQKTAEVTLKLAGAQQAAVRSQVQTDAARAALRRTALSAYLGTQTSPHVTTGLFGPVYQAGLAHVYADDAVGTVSGRVKVLRAAEARTVALRKVAEGDARQAQADQAAAVAALGVVQSATQTAAALQVTLTTTLAQVKGDLVALINAEQAGMAWQTYSQLGGGQLLDFVPKTPLPALLGQVPAAMAIANAELGKPYVWGATGPDSFDCSGLMQWSWAQVGVKLPRVAADQQAWATPVPISQVLPGDLVFFGAPASHVGMYLGNGMMLDAPHTGAFVEIVPIWWNELSGFGRVHP